MQAKNAKCLLFFKSRWEIQVFRLKMRAGWVIVADGREAVFWVHAGGIVHSAPCTVQAFPVLFWYFVGFHSIWYMIHAAAARARMYGDRRSRNMTRYAAMLTTNATMPPPTIQGTIRSSATRSAMLRARLSILGFCGRVTIPCPNAKGRLFISLLLWVCIWGKPGVPVGRRML